MITVNILEAEDVILPTDYVRQLTLLYNGQSDYVETTSCYGGGRINRMGWIRADEAVPAWCGSTVGTITSRLAELAGGTRNGVLYEFVRGSVPSAHLEPL